MTRERQPPGPVLQSAYGVLDEFDIPRNFFVKTDQKDCDIGPAVPDVVPSNPEPQVRSPSKEMLPPEPSENINEYAANLQASPAEITETKPADVPAPVKQQV